MPNIRPSESLRVLQWMLQLHRFTMPELSSTSGATYETVRRVVGQEEGRGTLTRAGSEPPVSGTGRPRVLWEIADSGPLRDRLSQVRDLVGMLESDVSSPLSSTQLHLQDAEDNALRALSALSTEDAEGYAQRAIYDLDQIWPPSTEDDTPDPAAEVTSDRQKLVRLLTRAILSHDSSPESAHLIEVVDFLEEFDYPPHDAFHKQMALGIIRHSEMLRNLGSNKSPAQLAGESSTLSQLRDYLNDPKKEPSTAAEQMAKHVIRSGHIPAVTGVLISQIRSSEELNTEALERLIRLASCLLKHASIPLGVADHLHSSLEHLAAARPSTAGARVAIDALASSHRNCPVSFWQEILDVYMSDPAIRLTALEGMAHKDLGSAFSFINDQVRSRRFAEDDLRQVLVDLLPKLAQEGAGIALQELYADFVAAQPSARLRSLLAGLPHEIGLAWSSAPAEERTISRYLGEVWHWSEQMRVAPTAPGHDKAPEQIELAEDLIANTYRLFEILPARTQTVVCDLLTDRLDDPKAAYVAVKSLLSVRRVESLVTRLFQTVGRDPDRLAEWYFASAPIDDLSEDERSDLLGALLTPLDRNARAVFTKNLCSRPFDTRSFDAALSLVGTAALDAELLSAVLEWSNPTIRDSSQILLELAYGDESVTSGSTSSSAAMHTK